MPERAKTVLQALRVLESLRDDGPGTAGQLGRRLGFSRSAAARILASLEAHRFVRRAAGGFDIGYGLLQFTADLEVGIRSLAAAPLHRLAASFDETAALAVRDGDDAVALEQVVPSERVVSIQYRPGTRHPLTVGAHGLAMLADVNLHLHEVPEALIPRLAEVARVGFAVSRDELEVGVTGVAAPIGTDDGPPIAAIGIVAPTSRFPDVDEVADAVMAAARTINADLGGMTSRNTSPRWQTRRTQPARAATR